jgi:hypothetical protein
MANEMSTMVKVISGNEKVAQRLKELFKPESEKDHEASAVSILNVMLGANYSYNNKEGWDRETDWPTNEIWDSYIGPKWMYVDYDHSDNPEDCHITIRSAWYVPSEFLSKLAEQLYTIDEECFIYGNYEDESYDPIGAFLYAKGWDDIEDLDEEIDFDRMWEDDEYRDEIWDMVAELQDSMVDSYKEYLEDKKNNPEDYE